VVLRLLPVLVAAVVIAVLALRLGDARACDGARDSLFQAALTRQEPRSEVDRHVATIRDRCEGSAGLVAAAGALRTLERSADALALAREATRREPEAFPAWRAVTALATGAERDAAVRRVTALNPRYGSAAEGP
jgi:hypothetical protein